MSSINTNGINEQYPIPGVNNSSQGFRDNFQSIKTNLNTAANEISELQYKAVLKQGLTGVPLNNNMANTLISNALVQGFRAMTFDLGNNLSGQVVIDCSRADVHHGTCTGNVTLQFAKWVPDQTQGVIDVILTLNGATTIMLPTQVIYGHDTLENWNPTNRTITVPVGVSRLHWRFISMDCGASVTVEPVNRPRQTTQLQTRVPVAPVGAQGDRAGTITTDGTFLYVCKANYDGVTPIWTKTPLTAW